MKNKIAVIPVWQLVEISSGNFNYRPNLFKFQIYALKYMDDNNIDYIAIYRDYDLVNKLKYVIIFNEKDLALIKLKFANLKTYIFGEEKQEIHNYVFNIIKKIEKEKNNKFTSVGDWTDLKSIDDPIEQYLIKHPIRLK